MGPEALRVRDGLFVGRQTGREVFLGLVSSGFEVQEQGWQEQKPGVILDFDRMIRELKASGVNGVRLWVQQSTMYDGEDTTLPPRLRPTAQPMPWLRSGKGRALDGRPRFDLTKPDPAYYERLRSRVDTLARNDMYAWVMLFQGIDNRTWDGTGANRKQRDHFFGHFLRRRNNIQRLGPKAPGWTLHKDGKQNWRRIQRNYVKLTVDALRGYTNVLWEVGNEMRHGNHAFQERVASWLRNYDQEERLIGMSVRQAHNAGVQGFTAARGDRELWSSSADFIAPRLVKGAPVQSNRSKAVIADDDHFAPFAYRRRGRKVIGTHSEWPNIYKNRGYAGYSHLHPGRKWWIKKSGRPAFGKRVQATVDRFHGYHVPFLEELGRVSGGERPKPA